VLLPVGLLQANFPTFGFSHKLLEWRNRAPCATACPAKLAKIFGFSRSTDVTSIDLVSTKGKTKEVYCCDMVVFIVLF